MGGEVLIFSLTVEEPSGSCWEPHCFPYSYRHFVLCCCLESRGRGSWLGEKYGPKQSTTKIRLRVVGPGWVHCLLDVSSESPSPPTSIARD